MDGRDFQAAAALGLDLQGHDGTGCGYFILGATKNGAMGAEAVIVLSIGCHRTCWHQLSSTRPNWHQDPVFIG